MKHKQKPYIRYEYSLQEANMIEELSTRLLLRTKTQVLRFALAQLYLNVFRRPTTNKVPGYSKANDGFTTGGPKTEADAILTGENICNALDGKVEIDEDGVQICKYKTYTKGGDNVFVNENITPLTEISSRQLENQFKGGNKSEILTIVNKQYEEAIKDINS